MKYFLLIFIFLITSCSPPELETDDDISSPNQEREELDKNLIIKHSIFAWLMDDNFMDSINDPSSKDDKFNNTVYVKVLKQCSANFSIMYGNMEAGLLIGKTITGLDDVNEISRLSDEYKNHAYYFGTRAMEIDFNVTNEEDYTAINEEIWLIQDEINKIHSNEDFIALLEANAQICIMIRNQNPNNKDYNFNE